MRQGLTKLFLFLVLSVFLFGTTGVSFYIHECSSSQKRDVFLYPEISNKTASCCCAEEVHGSGDPDNGISSFDQPECCKNTHVYLKVSFSGFPVFYQFDRQIIQTALPADCLKLTMDDEGEAMSEFKPPVDHPPPRSGVALIHFLHQIKIPTTVS